MMNTFVFCVVFLWVTSSGHVQGKITKCDKTSSCSCDTDNGFIDLKKLAALDGVPRFKDLLAPNGDKFSWNPCESFTEGNCNDVAACQLQGLLPPSYFNIGTQDSAEFSVDAAKGPQITYSADTFMSNNNLTFLRKTVVTLICDESRDPGVVTADGETPAGSGTYVLSLSSKYACEQSSGLSVGSILLVISFVTLVLYLTGGISIQKFVRHAEGKEMVPNYNFWSQLPGLIRDGVYYSLGRCGLKSRSKTYEEM